MKNSNPDNTPTIPGTEPNTVSKPGSINPSAPTAGTEGYGTTRDERANVGGSNPAASHPSAEGAGDVRRTSYPRNEADDNPAAGDLRSRSQQLSDNPNARGGKTFHCADVGPMSCNWTVTGNSEEEMMPEIERHGREAHGMTNIDEKMRSRVRDAIRDRAA